MSSPHKGEAKVRPYRVNLTNGTAAGAILAVGMIKKEGGWDDIIH